MFYEESVNYFDLARYDSKMKETKAYSELCQTSKMECFTTIVEILPKINLPKALS